MFKRNEIIEVLEKEYKIVKFLGHGKGGYSYLAECEGQQFVLKQLHHENCEFENKPEDEQRFYEELKKIGIRVSELIAIDIEKERIVKEYIEGITVYDLIKRNENVDAYIEMAREMAYSAKKAGYNLDYMSTNFVVRDGMVWYIDYGCNEYTEEFSFEKWGIKYWSRTPEFIEGLNNSNKMFKDNLVKRRRERLGKVENNIVKKRNGG